MSQSSGQESLLRRPPETEGLRYQLTGQSEAVEMPAPEMTRGKTRYGSGRREYETEALHTYGAKWQIEIAGHASMILGKTVVGRWIQKLAPVVNLCQESAMLWNMPASKTSN